MGLRGMQMEENAKRLRKSLSEMEKQMERKNAFWHAPEKREQSYSESDKLFEKAQNLWKTCSAQVSRGFFENPPSRSPPP